MVADGLGWVERFTNEVYKATFDMVVLLFRRDYRRQKGNRVSEGELG